EKSIFDDHPSTPARFQNLDEMLKEKKRSLAGADGKVLLHLLALFAAERWISHYHFVAILFLNGCKIFGEGVGVNDVRRFDAMQDHVHDRDDIRERFLFLAVKSFRLESDEIFSRQFAV